MAKYELSENQVNILRQILANAQIKGADAPVIIELANALAKPVPDAPRAPKKPE